MAGKGKDSNTGKHVSKGTTSPSNSHTPTTTTTTTTTTKKTPKQPPPPSPLEKRVPHYLKPTASSRPDGPKPARNSVISSKPAGLDRRRSFEKPSPSTLTKPSPPSSTTRRTRPPRSLSLSPITSAAPSTKKKKKKENTTEPIKPKETVGDPTKPVSHIPGEHDETQLSAWSVEDELSEIESQGVPSDISILESSRDRVDDVAEEETIQEPPAEGGCHDMDEEDERVSKSTEMMQIEEGDGREMKVKEREMKYNDVIEERRSQLLEEKKNKVKALVGAFETVISLQEPDS